MSASSSPTRYPRWPSATARFTATVVLPTPPLPLPTATTCPIPGKGCGPCGAPAPICPIQISSASTQSVLAHNEQLNMPSSPKRRSSLLRPLCLLSPHLSPPARVREPPLLVLGLRNRARHRDRAPLSVHRDISHVGRRNMPQRLPARVFHHRPHPNLHAGAERPVHAGLQNQQIAHMDRSHKV